MALIELHDSHVWLYYRLLDEQAAQAYILQQDADVSAWLLGLPSSSKHLH